MVQALCLSAFGIYEFFQVQPGRVMTGIVTALLILLWGVGLGAGGWAMLAGRQLARGPVVAVEILHLPTAWSFRGGETTWVMLLMGLTSVAVIVLTLWPTSTRYLTSEVRPD